MSNAENKFSSEFGGPQFVHEDKSGKEVFNITSVGVLVHRGELKRGGYPEFLLVEQLDEEGHPWGVPAGRSKVGETPMGVAIREVYEESGLAIDPQRLKMFLYIDKGEGSVVRRKIIFSYQVTQPEIEKLGVWKLIGNVWLLEPQSTEGQEIGRIALVSNRDLFERDHPIIRQYYRWDIWHSIKAKLEGLSVI